MRAAHAPPQCQSQSKKRKYARQRIKKIASVKFNPGIFRAWCAEPEIKNSLQRDFGESCRMFTYPFNSLALPRLHVPHFAEFHIAMEFVYVRAGIDRKSTRLNSSHIPLSRMPSSA